MTNQELMNICKNIYINKNLKQGCYILGGVIVLSIICVYGLNRNIKTHKANNEKLKQNNMNLLSEIEEKRSVIRQKDTKLNVLETNANRMYSEIESLKQLLIIK